MRGGVFERAATGGWAVCAVVMRAGFRSDATAPVGARKEATMTSPSPQQDQSTAPGASTPAVEVPVRQESRRGRWRRGLGYAAVLVACASVLATAGYVALVVRDYARNYPPGLDASMPSDTLLDETVTLRDGRPSPTSFVFAGGCLRIDVIAVGATSFDARLNGSDVIAENVSAVHRQRRLAPGRVNIVLNRSASTPAAATGTVRVVVKAKCGR